MQPLEREVIDGANNFIQKQQQIEGEALITLALFSDTYELLLDGADLATVEPNFLTAKKYNCGGMTSLYDAIGRTLSAVRVRHANTMPDHLPENVVVLIQTDGGENSSQEYNRSSAMKLVEEQTAEQNWEFVYLGAASDAFSGDQHQVQAHNMCIPVSNQVQYTNSAKGLQGSYAVAYDACSNARMVGSTGLADGSLDANAIIQSFENKDTTDGK